MKRVTSVLCIMLFFSIASAQSIQIEFARKIDTTLIIFYHIYNLHFMDEIDVSLLYSSNPQKKFKTFKAKAHKDIEHSLIEKDTNLLHRFIIVNLDSSQLAELNKNKYLKIKLKINGVKNNKIIYSQAFIPSEPAKFPKSEKRIFAPRFAGGKPALEKWINSNLLYPPQVQDASGTVMVRYLVSPTGYVSHVIILHSSNFMFNQEAERVIWRLPKFTPATDVNGNPVYSYMIQYVRFRK